MHEATSASKCCLHASLLPESICPYICPRWQEGPHLVTEQHDDHVLLGVLVDLSQPCLETDTKITVGDGKARTGRGKASQ